MGLRGAARVVLADVDEEPQAARKVGDAAPEDPVLVLEKTADGDKPFVAGVPENRVDEYLELFAVGTEHHALTRHKILRSLPPCTFSFSSSCRAICANGA